MTTSSPVILTAALLTILSSSSIIQAEHLYSEELVGGRQKVTTSLTARSFDLRPIKLQQASLIRSLAGPTAGGGGETKSSDETEGYKPGLINWAVNGPFVIIAANQWSARERDLLQCVAWLVEQNGNSGSEYYGLLNTEKIVLAGHSQGGGAALRSGNGNPKGVGLGLTLNIASVISMNPYGPAWNDVPQNGPVLIVGGDFDTTTPPESYEQAWQQIKINGKGGINASISDGTHNRDAWAPVDDYDNPQNYDFGRYQNLTLLW